MNVNALTKKDVFFRFVAVIDEKIMHRPCAELRVWAAITSIQQHFPLRACSPNNRNHCRFILYDAPKYSARLVKVRSVLTRFK